MGFGPQSLAGLGFRPESFLEGGGGAQELRLGVSWGVKVLRVFGCEEFRVEGLESLRLKGLGFRASEFKEGSACRP